jgi:hypothetical protein
VWPNACDDEPLFSILARLQIILGMTDCRPLLRTAFGGYDGVVCDRHLPRFLEHLTKANGGGITAIEDLLRENTSLPYLSRFLKPGRLDLERTSMLSGIRIPSLPNPFGIHIRDERPLSFCPECHAGDTDRIGLAAWRRIHQLPGVYVCPTHEIPLRFVDYSDMRNRWTIMSCPDDASKGRTIKVDLTPADALSLARGSEWLLRNPDVSSESSDLVQRAHDLLDGVQPCLFLKFHHRFTHRGHGMLRWSREKVPDKQWIGHWPFNPNPSAVHFPPVRFLTLLVMLDITPEEFFGTASDANAVTARPSHFPVATSVSTDWPTPTSHSEAGLPKPHS